MSTDAPKTTHYELGKGAVAILHEILPTPQWYKDDAKQGKLIGHAFDADEALPELDRPTKGENETDKEFQARAKAWASEIVEFNWTDKQKDAVKKCVQHYLKQGAFTVTKHTVTLLKLLGLDDE